jgi:activating signal cointegrator complex subunit 3
VDSTEFSQLPVRHNEDLINTDLAKTCPLEVNAYTMDSPHTKAHLLLQAHLSRLPLPCTDYVTDTKSVMDNALRVMQAMLDVCAESGWLASTLRIVTLLQMVVQARWDTDPGLLMLPHLEPHMLPGLSAGLGRVSCLPELLARVGDSYEALARPLRDELAEQQIEEIWSALGRLPLLGVTIAVDDVAVMNRRPTTGRAPQQQWIKVQTGVQVRVGNKKTHPKKTHPKNPPKKTHLNKPTKNVFFGGGLLGF